ncbi:MAG TPA: glucose 1-dehydrogenase [Dehalococcoidia bacterium]|nr:glucose 1-dehydrogenase [Dehalococcoidia bacterium]
MGRLEGKVAVITGAASGIGRASAILFAAEGAKVIAADWDEEKGRQVEQEIKESGGSAQFIKVDVSKPEDVQRMINLAEETYGRLDVVFNNAGVEGQQALTADCSLENWERVININLKGVFLGMKYAIPVMLKNGGGSIINTASVAGLVGFVSIPAYCASKGGVIQLTRTAALEYAKQGIRVNAICPGVIATPMVERFAEQLGEAGRQGLEAMEPVGRMGKPEEVAEVAVFLASDESSFCTGAPFIVDGGFVAA